MSNKLPIGTEYEFVEEKNGGINEYTDYQEQFVKGFYKKRK